MKVFKVIVAIATLALCYTCSEEDDGRYNKTCKIPDQQIVITSKKTVPAGEATAMIYLDTTQSGVNYELFKDGVTTDDIIEGSGTRSSFKGSYGKGIYKVKSVATEDVCLRDMKNAVVITEETAETSE